MAVFNNTDSPEISANTLMARIAAMAVGDPFVDLTAVPLDMEAVAPLLGEYRIDEGQSRKFYERDGKLYTMRTGASETEVFPAGGGRFFYGPASLTWFAVTQGKDGSLRMEMHQNGASEAEVAVWDGPIEAAPEVAIEPGVLASYAGIYTGPVGTLVLSVAETGGLVAKLNSQPTLPLAPQSQTRFMVQGVDAYVEMVLEDGTVTGVEISQGGQAIPFTRETDTE